MNENDIANLAAALKEVDPARFYRVDRFLDPEVQAFEVHVPVGIDGTPDASRTTRFYSSVVVNFQGKAHAQQFEIKAESLEDAVGKFRQIAAEVGGKTLDDLANAEAERKLLMSATSDKSS